ncbi:hypothetical protein FSARC_8452 [Fusarium sarcochroum]|uniref:Uncharacterized protein n=1 Tax=Fusarium sarcochroum TaxID=1208366 RepID=A0A8H4TT34_9HYPO|nr:hypothetical protein FSARC_8452 [Fusarium sarcochroum]
MKLVKPDSGSTGTVLVYNTDQVAGPVDEEAIHPEASNKGFDPDEEVYDMETAALSEVKSTYELGNSGSIFRLDGLKIIGCKRIRYRDLICQNTVDESSDTDASESVDNSDDSNANTNSHTADDSRGSGETVFCFDRSGHQFSTGQLIHIIAGVTSRGALSVLELGDSGPVICIRHFKVEEYNPVRYSAIAPDRRQQEHCRLRHSKL